jgi:acyl-ACP thioesterase
MLKYKIRKRKRICHRIPARTAYCQRNVDYIESRKGGLVDSTMTYIYIYKLI